MIKVQDAWGCTGKLKYIIEKNNLWIQRSEAQNQCLMNYISVYVMILITKFQCVEGDFPTLSSNSQIPAG